MKSLLQWVLPAAMLLCAVVAEAQPQGGSPFDRFDTNKDGKLSRDELPDFVRDRFAEIDTNKDGFISREEDRVFFSRMRPGPGGPGGPGGVVRLPETITVEKDIPYAATKNPRQMLDLYLPKQRNGNKKLPVVVNIHGGAFKMGSKTMGAREIAELVASGDFAGVSINYRLSGEAIWPAQIYDCKAAIRWVRANAAKYGLDADRIGAIGASAGGHLVAMLGTSQGVSALEGDVGPYKGTSTQVRCVVDQFGPSDLLAMGGSHDSPESPESELVGGSLQDHKEAARAASPITYVTRDDPPFLIFHGDADPAVPFNQSERLSKALKEAGVDCLFVPVLGAGHGGFRSPEVPRRIRQFFDRHLRDQKVGTISEEPIPNDGRIGPPR
ncbi:MAG: alpha/beta hydrolase fold domain-containing protein [Isosphaeraceae bacterium]